MLFLVIVQVSVGSTHIVTTVVVTRKDVLFFHLSSGTSVCLLSVVQLFIFAVSLGHFRVDVVDMLEAFLSRWELLLAGHADKDHFSTVRAFVSQQKRFAWEAFVTVLALEFVLLVAKHVPFEAWFVTEFCTAFSAREAALFDVLVAHLVAQVGVPVR